MKILQLSIEIIKGNSVDVIQELKPTITYLPATNKPLLLRKVDKLKNYSLSK